jgi:histidyl-tRNA synthetase
MIMKEKFELQNAKGVRDFLPEQMILRQKIINELKSIFELYGYNPLETPALERLEVLTSKFAGGEEILREIFKVEDQGGRDLGLRYDLTVPMCKVVGMNPNLNLPFKRYQVQEVYRDGPIKLGRYRSFIQCDIDVVGPKSMLAEVEILSIVSTFFSKYFRFIIKVNNRKLLNGILDAADIKEDKMSAVLSIDKLEKIGSNGVKKELEEKGFSEKEIKSLINLIETKGSNAELLERLEKVILSEEGKEGIKELKELLEYASIMGVKNIIIDISLARGLEYYTGPIFEVFLKDSEIKGSLAGGGRYDKMISGFLGSGDYPATGISFGIEPIFEALKLEKKAEERKTVSTAFLIPIKTIKESLKIAREMREKGIKTEIDLMERSIGKNLAYANSLGIPYVLFVGEKELSEKKVKLRDMKTGKEEMLSVDEVIKKLK